MATTADIEFVCGEDILVEDTVTGVNIAGWALAFAMARRYVDSAALTKTTDDGITITNGAGGIFQITIADTDTVDLVIGDYVWDVKRTDAGQEAVLTRGTLTLKPNVAA